MQRWGYVSIVKHGWGKVVLMLCGAAEPHHLEGVVTFLIARIKPSERVSVGSSESLERGGIEK